MLINVPIEELEERYSKQWNKWFVREFKRLKVSFTTVYPKPLRRFIKHGEFLDAIGTNYFKAQQLAMLCKMFDKGKVKNGDIIFLHDLWFPGLEMLFYMRDALGINVKIGGMLHAGSYDPNDFLYRKQMDSWGRSIEEGWFNEVDFIFAATKYHRDMLLKNRSGVTGKNIFVTPFPLFWEDIESEYGYNILFSFPFIYAERQEIEKENIVVFPHRLAPEKQPQLFSRLTHELKEQYPDWQFVKTKDVCKTKADYYKLLFKSKIAVAHALQETWGIAQQEAVLAGCVPVVPNRLSYLEMYSQEFQYETWSGDGYENLKFKVDQVIRHYETYAQGLALALDRWQFKRNGANSIEVMIHRMEGLK